MTEKLLVTGGSGFIGTEVVARALQRGFDVRNLDFKAPNLDVHAPFWVDVDVRNARDVEAAVLDFCPDRILHMASDVSVTLRKLEEYRTITLGTMNILRAAGKLESLKRFEYVSTQFVVMPGHAPKSEMELKPYTVYGEAKAVAERAVWETSLPWVIVRPTIIWGARHPSFAGQIWEYIARRAYLHPVGSAPILRCFGYVGNTADQMLSLLAAELKDRRIFYLGDGTIDYDVWVDSFSEAFTGQKARRIPKSALHLLAGIGSAMKAVGMPAPLDLQRYFRMTTSSAVDLAPTFELTGSPKIDFEAGLRTTVEWLRSVDPRRYGGHTTL